MLLVVTIIECSHYSSCLCQQSQTDNRHEMTITEQLDSTTEDSNLSTQAVVTHYYSDAITGSTVSVDDSVDGPHRKALNDFATLAIQYCGQSSTIISFYHWLRFVES